MKNMLNRKQSNHWRRLSSQVISVLSYTNQDTNLQLQIISNRVFAHQF